MEMHIGTDQSEFGPELSVVGDARLDIPMLSCSDQYVEFVRSKKIKATRGRITKASGDTITFTDPSGNLESMTDVAAIVCATGFEFAPSLEFLPADVLQTLEFDRVDDSFPLALNVNTTVSRKLPSLGFVGMIRSPYWGEMEMQARYLTKLWAGDARAKQALEEDTTMESMMKLRGNPRRAQFPMGDYPYLMESFAEILGKQPQSCISSTTTG